MKKEIQDDKRYQCSNCRAKTNTQYWNKITRGWECDKCTPYLDERRKSLKMRQNSPYFARLKISKNR